MCCVPQCCSATRGLGFIETLSCDNKELIRILSKVTTQRTTLAMAGEENEQSYQLFIRDLVCLKNSLRHNSITELYSQSVRHAIQTTRTTKSY